MSMLLSSISCQKRDSPPANSIAPQPEDHLVGTWKLNQDKTPVFAPRYNPIPVYEWIVISRNGDGFVLVFSHQSDKQSEADRVLVGDMKTPGFGVDALNGKLAVFPAYIRRIDPDSFVQGSTMFENEYKVPPGGKTMKVQQQPFIDNGFVRQLVYDRVANSNVTSFTRF
jgi:hypothetical protein